MNQDQAVILLRDLLKDLVRNCHQLPTLFRAV